MIDLPDILHRAIKIKSDSIGINPLAALAERFNERSAQGGLTEKPTRMKRKIPCLG
jgi:hypothetical protein